MSRSTLRQILVGVASWLIVTLLALNASPAAGPGVHGRVLGHDADGKFLGTVADAQIQFKTRDQLLAGETRTDKNGYYKMDLPPGEYYYSIVANGYQREMAGRGLKLKQNEGYALFNLALTQGETSAEPPPPVTAPKKIGQLQGHVTALAESGQLGVPGAQIALRREGTRELTFVLSRTSTTGQHVTGEYAIKLEAGVYHASVNAAGYLPLIDPTPIQILADVDTKRDFVLKQLVPVPEKGQGIRGVVTIIDAQKTSPPIQVEIETLDSSRPHIKVSSGANAAFTQDLPVGQYRVIASADGFPTAESPPIYVLPGRYSRVRLALRARPVPHPSTTVEVFVFSRSPDTKQALPLQDAKVTLRPAGVETADIKEASTDATGHVIFPVEKAGEYIAEAYLKGYRSGSGHGTVALDQSHEVGIELVPEVTPTSELKLLVQVSDATNKQPLAGAKVLARRSEQTLSVRGVTNRLGEATLTVAREGTYSVLAQLTDYEPAGVQVVASQTQPNRILIALKPNASPDLVPIEPQSPAIVTGYVAYREPTGQLRSVANAHLLWKPARRSQLASNQIVTTGNNGKYQLTLVPGSYEVQIEPPVGFQRLTEAVEVQSGQQEKFFVIQRQEQITPDTHENMVEVTGQVLTDVGSGQFRALAKAEVLFVRSAGGAKAVSDRNGRFSVRLTADHYRVHVHSAGFEPLEVAVDVHKNMSALRLLLKPINRSLPDSASGQGGVLNLLVVERHYGIVDKTMPPSVGALVRITQSGKLMYTGQTNAAGKYSVPLKNGPYSITVGKTSFANATAEIVMANRDVSQQLVLIGKADERPAEPSRKLNLIVHVAKRGSPSTAIKPMGDALAQAKVVIMRGNVQVATGLTNAAGNYVAQLPPGSYAVKVSAAGQAPAGKTIVLSDRDATLNFPLEGVPAGAGSQDQIRPSRDRTSGLGIRENLPLSQLQTWYIVEHRDNPRSPWVVLGEYSNQRDAQAALFRAVERGQIPGGAPAESRIRTVARTGKPLGSK